MFSTNENNSIEADIYYKSTNTHDYVPYNSAHPDQIKNNSPYNLVKTIIVFVSNPKKVIIRLHESKYFQSQTRRSSTKLREK